MADVSDACSTCMSYPSPSALIGRRAENACERVRGGSVVQISELACTRRLLPRTLSKGKERRTPRIYIVHCMRSGNSIAAMGCKGPIDATVT